MNNSVLSVFKDHVEKLRDLHRKWSEYRSTVAVQCDTLIANIETAKGDMLKDYDEVLRDIEDQIRFIEGTPNE